MRLRRDIAVQLELNSRPVLVDGPARRRIVAGDARSWELLRALDGARGPDEVLERLRAKGLSESDEDLDEIETFVRTEAASWWQHPGLEERSAAVQASMQAEKLARLGALVEFARKHVPHYRRALGAVTAPIDRMADLVGLPSLTKEDLRAQFPAGLLADGVEYGPLLRSGEAEILYSSGTTLDGGRTPSLHLAAEDASNFTAPFGVADAGERQARFSTPRCTGRECYIQQQSRAQRTYGPNLILNSSADPMFMSEPALREVAAELADWSPTILSGNPWYLATLLRFLDAREIPLPASIVAVICGTEFLSGTVRRYLIERAGLIPFDNYSASEVGNIATTCPLGVHHVFDDVLVEIVRDGRPAREGEVGEVVVSNLERRVMPLLRYRIGDLAAPQGPCACGLPQAAITPAGRMSETLLREDGFVTAHELDRTASEVDGLLFWRATQDEHLRVSLECCPVPAERVRASAIGDDLAARVARLGFDVGHVACAERLHARDSMKFSLVVTKIPDLEARVRRLVAHDDRR